MKPVKDFRNAQANLKGIVTETPLMKNMNFSNDFGANVYFKREDQQVVRSYKIRGAYNKLKNLIDERSGQRVVCASAGNHAQGVALSCKLLGVKGTIFMPVTTPKQKIKQVKFFGDSFIDLQLVGDTFDDSYYEAVKFCEVHNCAFVHPFDDEKVIEGQGTVGLEVLDQFEGDIDYVILPIGGGGLAAGVSSVFKQISPKTKIIGVEPKGAPSMSRSIENGTRVKLEKFDKFVDGASVGRVGALNFEICKETLDEVLLVSEGEVCAMLLKLYNEEAIVVEPAGALSVAALRQLREHIQGKNVVCIISGSNNDITRTEEIKERALFYEGLKHYFLIKFPQRPGALKDFVSKVLGPDDDITYFQFSKKNNRENGPAVVGVEVATIENFHDLKQKMEDLRFQYEYLNDNQLWFDQLVSMS
jgi:threonine dehydratase